MTKPRGSTLILTHVGRRSGRRYRVKVWFVVIDGATWIGSIDAERSWVKNVRASGRAELDFGAGASPYCCQWADSKQDILRFQRCIARKHPILARLLQFFVRGKRPCVFRATPLGAKASARCEARGS